MINLETFKKININRCIIMLNESESYYLYSKFNNIVINNRITESNLQNHLYNLVSDFYQLNENRYFKEKDLIKVTNYFTKKILKKINRLDEEIGRGRQGEIGDQVSNNKVVNYHSGVSVAKGVDTFGEKDIMFIEDEEGNEKTIKVDDPDHANVVASQMKVKSISKNNL